MILPLETGYAVAWSVPRAGSAGHPPGLSTAAITKADGWVGPVWLALSVDEVLSACAAANAAVPGSISAAGLRLISRLAPGPAVFRSELAPEALEAFREAAHLPPGSADDGRTIAFRVPATAATLSAAARSSRTLVAVELPARSPEEAAALLREFAASGPALEPAAALDDGPPASRHGPTVLRLGRSGDDPAFVVVREGAYEARFINKQLELTLLFVCTGNTCRSPMAAAIAEHVLAQPVGPESAGPPAASRSRVWSAGVAAGTGAPISPEAASALREIGVMFPTGKHASRPLTRRMIAEADVIYAMTRSHQEAVLDLDPGAAGKVQTLDTHGRDIPDPIGQPRESYIATARRLHDLVVARLKELRA